MSSHIIDYEIFGDDMQTVEVTLDPLETVVAEAGAMNWMHPEIQFETKMGDGSAASKGFLNGMLQVGKRVLTGCCKNHRRSSSTKASLHCHKLN